MDKRTKANGGNGKASAVGSSSGALGSGGTQKKAGGGTASNAAASPVSQASAAADVVATQAKAMESLCNQYVNARRVCEAAGTLRVHHVGDVLALCALLAELPGEADVTFAALVMSALASDEANEAFSLVRTQQCGVEMEWHSRGSPRVLRRAMLRGEQTTVGSSGAALPRSPVFSAAPFPTMVSPQVAVGGAPGFVGTPTRAIGSPTTAHAAMGGGNSSNGKTGGRTSAVLVGLHSMSPTTPAATIPTLTEADQMDRRSRVDLAFHCIGLTSPASASYCKLVPLVIQRPGMRVNTLWAILHFAAAAGNLGILRQMIQEMRSKTIFVSMVGRLASQCRGFCLTHAAALHGEIAALALLTNQGGLSLFQDDEYGWTCAHNAAQSGQVDTLRFLSAVNSTRTLSLRTATGWSVAHVAAASNQYYVLMWLLEERRVDMGADTDVRGATPLHYLAQLAFVDTLRWLCEHAVSCINDLQRPPHGAGSEEPPLTAIQQKVLGNAHSLLSAIANARDATGMTPEELMLLHPECQEGGRYAEDAALVLQWVDTYRTVPEEEPEEVVDVALEAPLLSVSA